LADGVGQMVRFLFLPPFPPGSAADQYSMYLQHRAKILVLMKNGRGFFNKGVGWQ
jgi:hypothetical protein